MWALKSKDQKFFRKANYRGPCIISNTSLFVYIHTCVSGMHTTVCMWKSEYTLWELDLSFHHVASREVLLALRHILVLGFWSI